MDFEITPLNFQSQPKMAGRKSKKWLVLVFVLALIFIAGGLILFFFYRSSFSEGGVEFKINGPVETSSGEKVSYEVEYSNNNKEMLRDLKLTFFYPPESVVVKDGQVSQFLTENIKLPDLGSGQSNKVEFSAYLVGDRGDIKKARSLLVYSPEKVRSTFEKEATLATNISSLAVSLTLVAPPNTVSGQEVAYLLDYRNESPEDLSDLKLKFAYPDGFSQTRTDPLPSVSPNIWDIKSIKSGEGKRISVFGTLRGSERESKQVAVVLQRKVDGIFIDYEKASSTTVISTPPLSTKISVNGKSNYIAQPGDELNYEIKFANNTDVSLLGITVSVKLDGSMFDLSSLLSDGFFESSSRTVTWNASVSPLLNRLAARQEGAVNFRVKLKSNFAGSGLGAKDFVIKVSAKAETATVPAGFDLEKLTAESELVTKIASLPVLSQTAFYKDETFGNTGPIPPKVNKKTFYTVLWEVSNSSGEFSKIRVKGVLPVGTNWENKARASGQLPAPSFKTGSREVVWDLGALPSGVGNQFPKYQAWFQISFTPSSNNVGQTIKLMQDTFMDGEDTFTKQAISVKVKDITTDDLVDFPGQGSVVE